MRVLNLGLTSVEATPNKRYNLVNGTGAIIKSITLYDGSVTLDKITNFSDYSAPFHNVLSYGSIVYTNYFLAFIVASVILLVGMLGSIVLTLNKKYIKPYMTKTRRSECCL
jgi:NADH:ubiquinone oxidoreductase subunit 6 (subunit J)